VPRFVERSSGQLIPFFLDRTARRSFGATFTDAWHAVRDSARADAGVARPPMSGWRRLASGFDVAEHPRWLDSSLVVSASTGRETPGAYLIARDGSVRRIGRRVGGGANTPLADGGFLVAQLEFDGPYRVRSDLYVERAHGSTQLTHNARLSQPDARGDGEIVAVRTVAGSTHLARVARDGSRIWPLVPASLDTQWAEPRWSPKGDRIVAVRSPRGALSEIVVLDTLGDVEHVLARESNSVSASPSWTPDGLRVVYSSDRTGRRELYAVDVPPRDAPVSLGDTMAGGRRISDAATAIEFPDAGPEGAAAMATEVAAVHLEANGFVVGIAPLLVRDGAAPDGQKDSAMARSVRSLPAASTVTTQSRRYSPWATLLPRYWFPIVSDGNGETRLGASTSAEDVVGRHAYVAEAWAGTRGIEQGGAFYYEWAGLANPLLDLGVEQNWDALGAITDVSGTRVGTLRRRMRTASASLLWRRVRTRNSLALRLGAELEARDYAADTRALLARLPAFYQRTRELPAILATISGANTQHPSRSMSPEDGFGAHLTAARHWESRVRASGYTRVTGAVAAYKSLDLPGYAHHVIAVRGAGGWTDARDGTELTVGGSSGDEVAIATTSVGGRREFPVRGYVAGSLGGTRVVAGSAEYRMPAFRPSRGVRFLPVFIDRTSVSVFSDAAAAWCPETLVAAGRCGSASRPGRPLVSAGAELLAQTAFPYDAPLLLRLGYAAPVGRVPTGTSDRGVYFSFGLSF
jgi:hypothetical protein